LLCAVKFRKMKVVCINAKPIKSADGSTAWATGLKEGQIYNSLGKTKSRFGDWCYEIEGIGLKQCVRFKRAEDDWVEELLARISEEVEAEECVSA
jgi:hypothetical protein